MIAVCKKQAAECVRMAGDLTGMQIAVNLIPGQRWNCMPDDKYFFVWRQKDIKFRITRYAFEKFFNVEKAVRE